MSSSGPGIRMLKERGSQVLDCNFQRDMGFCMAVWSGRRTRSLLDPVRVPLRPFSRQSPFQRKFHPLSQLVASLGWVFNHVMFQLG